VRVYPIEIFEVVEPLPDDPLIQLIAEKIMAQMGAGTVVSVNHLGLPGLWVSFSIDDEDFWVVIPKIRTERPAPWQWVEWGALMLTLSLAGAYFIAARINRPLHLLAKAADQVARGIKADRLPEYGVEELQRMSHTFNEMTDALARLDSERTLLLAGVSHDLRTPLARLRLSVEMLSASDALKSGMIQDIEDMDGIIRQFLDFVRGLEGETEQKEDLNALIQSCADRYARSGKTLHLNLGTVPQLMLRPLAMQRLLGNLIDNAFAYGGKIVEIMTRNQNGIITLSVMDDGPGIPEQEMDRLLRPFERLDSARGQDGGSGLGLAISDRIARMHGGSLSLHNRPRKGLEVRITLPRKG
jgi:two-component system osmolarity sensor histidine kinase EnvZ